MANGTKWQLTGDYFENCNCDVVCPCLVSRSPPLTAKPTQGECDVALAFHIDRGSYGQVSLDGLNVVVAVHTPGPMADGNWSLGAYIDERATDEQTAALGAIFGGGEGGPMAAFAPLVATNLGMKKVPIRYAINGKVAVRGNSGDHEYVGRACADNPSEWGSLGSIGSSGCARPTCIRRW